MEREEEKKKMCTVINHTIFGEYARNNVTLHEIIQCMCV